jgi:hypothetical protein
MRTRSFAVLGAVSLVAAQALLLGSPARADHTNPSAPLSPIDGAPAPTLITRGEGTWAFIKNFPPNPGTDQKFFVKNGVTYVASGTLGQANTAHVGQRIVRLANSTTVDPQWVADHGSASCPTANPSGTTGLQHDSAIAGNTEILVDTTDATGRCHDPGGGGLELIDISKLGQPGFQPREIHLTRHAGFSHTVTVDATRPWIVYNSSSDFSGRPWIDVLNIKSCLGLASKTLAQKRALCRPLVYRIPFQPDWTRQRNPDGTLQPGSEAACHDITSRGTRLYCAGLNASLIFDVRLLTSASNGAVRGTPLQCSLINGTNTGAKVTDCSGAGPTAPQRAEGWTFLGTFNHPGRTQGNTNHEVRSDEGVAVAHEADPSPNGKYMFVTDERGGGVVPGGSSCTPGIENPFGNGGIHVFDVTNPANIQYALQPDGSKAVWISDAIIPAATFCTVHVIEHIPDEQRLVVAYYSQGVKIVDYFIDQNGRFTFQERASLILQNANTWAFQQFRIKNNPDGTRTYYFVASDITRGIDVISWTGPTNRFSAAPPVAPTSTPRTRLPLADIALMLMAAAVLPVAVRLGRRRRVLGRVGWSMLFR